MSFVKKPTEAIENGGDAKKDIAAQMNLEQTSRNKVQGSLLMQYLKSGASPCNLLILFVLFVVTQMLVSSFDWFVSFWTRQEEMRTVLGKNLTSVEEEMIADEPLATETCLYIHGGLVLSLFVIGLIRALSFYSVCMRSSANLHKNMFQSLISTTMRFFDTNPSGRILNRFSKDMGATDEVLPKVILDSVQMVLTLIGVVILAVVVDYLFLIPMVILGTAFMYARKIYLKSSKNIKRLDGISEWVK